MKVFLIILIILIFILPVQSSDRGDAMATAALGVLILDGVIIYGGTSMAIKNVKFLSDTTRERPSEIASYIWGGLNLGIGTYLWKHNRGAPGIKMFGIVQTVIGLIDIGTVLLVNQVEIKYTPALLMDSNKKLVMGLNVKIPF